MAGDRAGVLMGWTPPRRHRCAKVEVLITPLEGDARVRG
jgi:hypothetical protein